MVSRLTHWAKVLRAYAASGEDGLADLAEEVEATAHDLPGGKFGKSKALYLPQAPLPPTVWRTSCGRCRFYEEGEPGEPPTCHIVGRPGDRHGGEAIHYRGWCAYWMPPPGEPALAWIGNRFRPDGTADVRGEYDPATTARKRARQEEPPAIEDVPPDSGASAESESDEPEGVRPDGG